MSFVEKNQTFGVRGERLLPLGSIQQRVGTCGIPLDVIWPVRLGPGGGGGGYTLHDSGTPML